MNEIQGDFNTFEHLMDLLDDRVSSRNKAHYAYEKLCEWKKHIKNAPQVLPLLKPTKSTKF